MKIIKFFCVSILVFLILICIPSGLEAGLFGSGSLEKPVKVPTEEIQKLKGTAKVGGNYVDDVFSASIYNGSKWNIVDVHVKVTKGSESRIFVLSTWRAETEYHPNGAIKKATSKKLFAKPFENCDFIASVGTFLEGAGKADWSWRIEAVYGFQD